MLPKEDRARYQYSETFCLSMRRRQRHPAKVARMLALLSCRKREESVPGLLANILRSKGKFPRVQAPEVRVLPTPCSRPKPPRRAHHCKSTDLIILLSGQVSAMYLRREKPVQIVKSLYVDLDKRFAQDAACFSRSRLSRTLITACLTLLERQALRLMEAYRSF
jgi:hypothetical protein